MVKDLSIIRPVNQSLKSKSKSIQDIILMLLLNRLNVMNIVKENMDIFDFFTQHFCDKKAESKKADSRLKHN
jgi:F0F1-type ATP synthase beta subunit